MSAVVKEIKPTQSKKWQSTCPGFEIRQSNGHTGLWRIPDKGDPRLVSGPMAVAGLARESDSTGWSVVVDFENYDGASVRWLMPLSLLTDFNEIERQLLSRGLFIVRGSNAKTDLSIYLSSKGTKRFAIVDKSGWHGDSFLMGDEVVGDGEFIQRKSSLVLNKIGTLESWKQEIAAKCVGNSRLIFAVSGAFASPLLDPLMLEGGGIHLVDGSTSGKTTGLKVVSTVFGLEVSSWRATDNAIEGSLANHNCIGFILDDIGQVNPALLGLIIYMLGNGAGKSRATRDGSVRDALTFDLLAFSTGEIGIADCMKKAGLKPMAGQELRLLNVSADAGAGMGMFENLHGYDSAKDFADELNRLAKGHGGHAGHAFLESIVKIKAQLPAQFEAFKAQFKQSANLGIDTDSQVLRAADRFCLIGFAGELATNLGLTGWPESEAMDAALKCFSSWCLNWAPSGSREAEMAINQVRGFLQSQSDRFAPVIDDTRPITNRAGYRDLEAFYIYPNVFKTDVCEGIAFESALKALEAKNYLIRDKNKQRQKRVQIQGNRQRFYAISRSILGDAEDSNDGE